MTGPSTTMPRGLRRALAALLVALHCASVSAQTREQPTWVPLNASIPEHAAIGAWHRALVGNDYASYRRHTGDIPGLGDQDRRAHFAKLRSVTPAALMISANPTRVNSNGVKEYFVAGCVKVPGDPRELRVLALLMPHQKDGQWRVLGSDFGPPWNDTARACPVK